MYDAILFITNNVINGYLRIGFAHGGVNHIAHNAAKIPSPFPQ